MRACEAGPERKEAALSIGPYPAAPNGKRKTRRRPRVSPCLVANYVSRALTIGHVSPTCRQADLDG